MSVLLCLLFANAGFAQDTLPSLVVRKSKDFPITGKGENAAWQKAQWISLEATSSDNSVTQFKILYSDKGLYFLFQNDDKKITATKDKDYEKLWLEDVVEVFLWTDTTATVYFEYELSPNNYELPLIIPNFDGKFMGWIPWNYEGDRRIVHQTHIEKDNNKVTRWYAEFFIPYALLNPLRNVPPKTGTVWRGNMYRIDYDSGKSAYWSWSKTESNFHQYSRFGKLLFE